MRNVDVVSVWGTVSLRHVFKAKDKERSDAVRQRKGVVMGRGVKETGYVSDVDFVVNTVRVNKVSLENVGLCRNCVGDGKGSMSKGLKVLSINVKVKGLLINVTKDI